MLGDFTEGLAAARHGDIRHGAAAMNEAVGAMRATGAAVGVWYLECLLAEAELAAGRVDEARAALADAAGGIGSGGSRNGAEIVRLQGELALAEGVDPAARELAERRFTSAMTQARRQGARTLELRAATGLARLWAEAGEAGRATELLAPIADAVSAGGDTIDVSLARALLGRLGSDAPGASRRLRAKR